MIAKVAATDACSIFSTSSYDFTSIDGDAFANTVLLSATDTSTAITASCYYTAIIHDKTAAVCTIAAANTSSIISFSIDCTSMYDKVATCAILSATNTSSIVVVSIRRRKRAAVFSLAIDGEGSCFFKFHTTRKRDIGTIAKDDMSIAKDVQGLISDSGFFDNIPSASKPNPIA